MELFINIETSTDICSATLSQDDKVIDKRENQSRNHSSTLAIYIDELLKANNIKASELSGVAVSKGPGSYTGLRIGTSTAKGIAYRAGIKLLAVDTLQAMAHHAAQRLSNRESLICATIDAGRNEVYSELLDINNNIIENCKAEIITPESYSEILSSKEILFVGNGAEKISKIITNSNAKFATDILPSSEYMAPLTYQSFVNKEFADVAYFEPFYLKDFIATVSKKNVLNQIKK